nr:MAG TPA: hypothetical protein [Caudoviricetes sp.]
MLIGWVQDKRAKVGRARCRNARVARARQGF